MDFCHCIPFGMHSLVDLTDYVMAFSVNQDCLRQKNCSHMCRQTPKGPECFCKPGFVLDSDGISCNGKSIQVCRFFLKRIP